MKPTRPRTHRAAMCLVIAVVSFLGYLVETVFVAMTCSDEEVARRLKARPADRGFRGACDTRSMEKDHATKQLPRSPIRDREAAFLMPKTRIGQRTYPFAG